MQGNTMVWISRAAQPEVFLILSVLIVRAAAPESICLIRTVRI